jgi:hypothetical protein
MVSQTIILFIEWRIFMQNRYSRQVKQLLKAVLTAPGAIDTINRLADAFSFELPSPRGLARSTEILLTRGYR